MNIVEAMKRGLSGQKIKRLRKNEWMMITSNGSEMRWASNRQKVVITVDDIISEDWICEEDVIVISRNQIEEAFVIMDGDTVNGKKDFLKYLGFKWDLD